MKPFLLLIFVFCLGCSATQSKILSSDYHGNESAEEVTKKILEIAKNAMIAEGLDEDWNIDKPKIKFDYENKIGIKFYTKHKLSLNTRNSRDTHLNPN